MVLLAVWVTLYTCFTFLHKCKPTTMFASRMSNKHKDSDTLTRVPNSCTLQTGRLLGGSGTSIRVELTAPAAVIW